MASFRRTLSPVCHERSLHLNGVSPNPLSVNLPSHKLPQPYSARFLPNFVARVLSERTSRRGLYKTWKRPFLRCLMFFFVGFLLGILPFGHNVPTQNFSFEIKPQVIRAQVAEEEVKVKEAVLKLGNVGFEHVKLADATMLLDDNFDYKPRKLLIVVTPTYNRVLQAYYLNRLAQVLKLVNPPVMWIVVEMSAQTQETASILRDAGVMYRHLVCRKNLTDVKDRGVHQRNTALEHIELHKLDGIIYFADDDNVYSLELFERLRNISRFGTWPVAMLAPNKNKAILEGPICNGSQIIGWHTNEKSKRLRRFHVDMSGFAFNSNVLWDPKKWKRPSWNPIRQLDSVKEGFQETTFIEQLVAEESQMEGIPDGCTKIMNWHIHLDTRGVTYPSGWLLQQDLSVVLPIN